jgi:predicted DNA-binding antitoxin AbrB/MazE fold protein
VATTKSAKQTLDAVYEHGVFRVIDPQEIEIPEGQRVRLVVEPAAKLSPDEMLELAFEVYDGLSPEEIQEIERIALDRSNFFGDRKPT